MRDENIRLNKQAGLIPNETAVQIVNGLTVKETHEYIEKINEEKAQETARNAFGQYPFNDSDYYNESGVR